MKTVIIIVIIFLYSFFIAFILKQKPHHIPLLCDNILKEINDEQREFERKIREIRLEKEQNIEEKEQNIEEKEVSLEKKKKGCEHLVGMYCLKKEKGIPVKIYEIKEYIDNSFYLCEEHSPIYSEILIKLESLEGYSFFETKYAMKKYIDFWQNLAKNKDS